MMSDPIRMDLDGNPLNDTWSNYRRLHKWVSRGQVQEDLGTLLKEWARIHVRCSNCHQTRRILPQVMGDEVMRWGCPRIPLWYELRLWWRKTEIPDWDVNTRPPWLAITRRLPW